MTSILEADYPELFRFVNEKKIAIHYSAPRRLFQIGAEEGGFGQAIMFCPWTGKKLPRPLSEEFSKLLTSKDLSILEPETWPEKWRSERWWIEAGL